MIVLPLPVRNDMLNAVRDRIDAAASPGRLKIYAGTTLLGDCALSQPCAPDAVAGSLAFGPIGEQIEALADGTADRAVLTSGDGTVCLEFPASGPGGEGVLVLDPAEIKRGGPIRVESLTIVTEA